MVLSWSNFASQGTSGTTCRSFWLSLLEEQVLLATVGVPIPEAMEAGLWVAGITTTSLSGASAFPSSPGTLRPWSWSLYWAPSKYSDPRSNPDKWSQDSYAEWAKSKHSLIKAGWGVLATIRLNPAGFAVVPFWSKSLSTQGKSVLPFNAQLKLFPSRRFAPRGKK